MKRLLVGAVLAFGMLPAGLWAQAPAGDRAFNQALTGVRTGALEAKERFLQVQAVSNKERDVLLALLRDPDAEVRRLAVRALKAYIAGHTIVRGPVMQVAGNRSEELAVRREAVKTLSAAGGYLEVREVLFATARRSEETELRAIAYKALYPQAAARSDVRDRLLEAALDRGSVKEVRLGAVWGLFASSVNSRVYEPLAEIAASRSADGELRVEAVKSLYGAMAYSKVRELMTALARDRSSPIELRGAAILALSADLNSRTRDLLIDIARNETEAQLRQAAVLAMNPGSEDIARFFHIVRTGPAGQAVDPLDDE